MVEQTALIFLKGIFVTERGEISSDLYEAFLAEFSRERDFLSAYIHSLLPNSADADDVLQRCSILLWRKFGEFDSQRSFRAWASGVAFYEVKNFLRTSRRKPLHFSSELMERIADERLLEASTPKNQLSLLKSCLKQLNSSDRELVRAAYWKTESLKDVAKSEAVHLKTLYNRLWRVRKTLLDCVQKKLALEEGGQHV